MIRLLIAVFCGLFAGGVTGAIGVAILDHLGVGDIRFVVFAGWLLFCVAGFIKERNRDY